MPEVVEMVRQDKMKKNVVLKVAAVVVVVLSDYARLGWFFHLGPLIHSKYACDIVSIGVTVMNFSRMFSKFSCS